MVAVFEGAPGPVASEVIGPVVLFFTPALVAVTLTERLQLPGESMAAPATLILRLPGATLAPAKLIPPLPG
jgi:hypothetical protein